jgi:hypothetical protein
MSKSGGGSRVAAIPLTRTHRILVVIVVSGAVIIAGIGFAGSYAAVRELAEKKGFGRFSLVFPIGIDAGICVLLALFPVKFSCSNSRLRGHCDQITSVTCCRTGRQAIYISRTARPRP